MSVITLSQTDPQGRLQSTPDEPNGTNDALTVVAGLVNMFKKYQLSKQNNQFSRSAAEAVKAGNSDVSYDYDPATGKYKAKIAPKKDNTAAQVRRYVAGQQFGVDPVTGQPIPQEQLKKPRFGYTGDVFSQLLAGLNPGGSPAAGVAPNMTPAAPAAQPSGNNPFSTPSAQAAPAAGIQMPSVVPGQQPQFLDALDLEAQNAIASGADPVKVRARVAQIREASRGSV